MTNDIPRLDLDSPWKEMLEQFFPQFMAFFFPKAFQQIDWSRGYQFLDQELQQVVRDAEMGLRRLDKLVSVYLLNGQEAWVLIHIEIQGQKDDEFDERMYGYNYRVFDKYRRPVASLAILTDDQKQWRPAHYGYELFDCRVSLDFPAVKLLDYKERMAELANNNNPFAVVVMAHLQTQATSNKPDERYAAKMNLARLLYRRGYNRQEVLELFRFIDWIMSLPQTLAQQFKVEITALEERDRMPYVTSVERIAMEEGLQSGLQQGQQQGLQQGLQQGFRESILRILQVRFGVSVGNVEVFLKQITDVERLRILHDQAVTVPSLALFTEQLSAHD